MINQLLCSHLWQLQLCRDMLFQGWGDHLNTEGLPQTLISNWYCSERPPPGPLRTLRGGCSRRGTPLFSVQYRNSCRAWLTKARPFIYLMYWFIISMIINQLNRPIFFLASVVCILWGFKEDQNTEMIFFWGRKDWMMTENRELIVLWNSPGHFFPSDFRHIWSL